jgi:hypothetical protein
MLSLLMTSISGLQCALWPSGWLAENEGRLAVSENVAANQCVGRLSACTSVLGKPVMPPKARQRRYRRNSCAGRSVLQNNPPTTFPAPQLVDPFLDVSHRLFPHWRRLDFPAWASTISSLSSASVPTMTPNAIVASFDDPSRRCHAAVAKLDSTSIDALG